MPLTNCFRPTSHFPPFPVCWLTYKAINQTNTKENVYLPWNSWSASAYIPCSSQSPSSQQLAPHQLCQQILKHQDFLSDQGFTKHHPHLQKPLHCMLISLPWKHEDRAWSLPFLSTTSCQDPRPSLKGDNWSNRMEAALHLVMHRGSSNLSCLYHKDTHGLGCSKARLCLSE